MHPMQDYFWKVFHKYYNLICIFICTPICTKKILILAKSGCYIGLKGHAWQRRWAPANTRVRWQLVGSGGKGIP
jgi:hypothetical protein